MIIRRQRDVKVHRAMIELYQRMPLPLQRAKMLREQLGFALNREGYFAEAEKVLTEVIAEFGASSETNALLGRAYKDRWDPERESARGAGATQKRDRCFSPASRRTGATPIQVSMR